MADNLAGWSNLTDSAGRKVREYKLTLDEGGFTDVMLKVQAVGVELVWQVFVLVSTLAATLLGIIGNPSWLDGLDRTYQSITSKMFAFANPLVIAVASFSILLLWIFLDKTKSTSSRIESNDMNRIGAAIAMMVCIGALAANPFALLKFALSLVQAGVEELAGGSVQNYNVFSVDSMIRTPTLIINYGSAVSDTCAELWSRQGTLPDNGSCFDANADQPSAMMLILSVLALGMAVCALAFALVSVWKFLKHMTMTVLGFVSIPWVAAISMARRRQFDQIGAVFAVAVGNLFMVFIIQVIALGGPALLSELMSTWGASGNGVLQMLVMSFLYLLLTGVMVSATRKNSALVRALKADTSLAMRTYFGAPVVNRMNNMSSRVNLRSARHYGGEVADRARRLRNLMSNQKGKSNMEDLDPVQKVVNLVGATAGGSGSGKVVTSAVMLGKELLPGKGGAVTKQRRDGRGQFVPSTRGKGQPLGDVFDVIRELAAIHCVGNLDTAARRTPKALLGEDAIKSVRKSVPALKDLDDKYIATLVSLIHGFNRTAVNPLFGGRTPKAQQQQIIQNIIVTIINNINNGGGGEGAAPLVITPDGKRDGGGGGAALSPGEVAMMRRMERGNAEARMLGSTGYGTGRDDDTAEVQRSLGSGKDRTVVVPGKALTRLKVDSGYRNDLVGSSITPGDCTATAESLPRVMDRARTEADFDRINYVSRASGSNDIYELPDDPSQHAMFTGNPDHPVEPSTGVGFGDHIGRYLPSMK